MKIIKKELSSPHLKKLQKELGKLERAEDYLEKEKAKIINNKEKIRIKIKKERDVLRLKKQIKRVREKRMTSFFI